MMVILMKKHIEINLLSRPLELSDTENVKELIGLESGLYGGKAVEGIEFALEIQQGEEMSVSYYKENGWIEVHTYSGKTGLMSDNYIDGRWKKRI